MSLVLTENELADEFKFSHLPSEVITEIFLNVCDRELPTKPLNGASSAKRTLVVYPPFLGTICQEWRNIAWTCPLLWNDIHIPLSLRKYKQQLTLLGEWIGRTADCPLSINLEVHDGEGLWRGTDFLRGLFTLLVAQSSRWENIDIFLPKHSKGVLNAARLRVPLLRSATIRALNGGNVQLDFLKSAPRLQELNLKRISPKGVDCENLTRLVASFVSVIDLIATLQCTPSLQSCDLQNTYGDPDLDPILQFSLPFLQSLRMRDCHSTTFLPHFGIAPMLQDLEIFEWNDHLRLETISSFLSKTQSTMRSLKIGTGDSLDPNGLYVLLKGVDSLSSLEIQPYYAQGETEVFSVFLDILDPDISHFLDNGDQAQLEEEPIPEAKEKPILLPNLRKLGYQLPLEIANDHLERLVAIVRRRWDNSHRSCNDSLGKDHRSPRSLARLEVLQFDPFFSASQQIVTLLQKEIEEGLRITFDLPLVDSEDEDP